MSSECEIIALIPARGGSKRVPRKNIKLLDGKPLIYYTISEALRSKYLSKVYVSTEDKEIAKVSSEFGADTIDRPKSLARDETPGVSVARHAVDYIEEKGMKIKAICILQPTSPFRKSDHIDEAIRLFVSKDYDSVIGVKKVREHPYWSFVEKNDFLVPFVEEGFRIDRSQDLPDIYFVNGAIYVVKRDVIKKEKSVFGKRIGPLIMDDLSSFDIDTNFEFWLADLIMQSLRDSNHPK